MDYKKIMGYDEKKNLVKPKQNKVLKSIKEEFGYEDTLKEVGSAPQYKKFVKSIDNLYVALQNFIHDFSFIESKCKYS